MDQRHISPSFFTEEMRFPAEVAFLRLIKGRILFYPPYICPEYSEKVTIHFLLEDQQRKYQLRNILLF